MTQKEKFLQLVSSQETDTLAKARERKQNRAFIRRSQEIALAILDRLNTLKWSQKKLAEEMGITPQQVNKWVRGSENFTLETIAALEATLNITLISVRLQERKFRSVQNVTASAQYKPADGAANPLHVTYCIKKHNTDTNKYATAS